MQGRLEFLKENYRDMSIEELAGRMGVSTDMVKAMKKQNGLTKPSRIYREWTEEEDARLKEIYADWDWQDIVDEFHYRSQTSIRRRGEILGLERKTMRRTG